MPTEAEIAAHIALIDAAIDALVSGRVKSYRIGRRTFTRYSLAGLMSLRKMYTGELNATPVEEVTVYDDTDI